MPRSKAVLASLCLAAIVIVPLPATLLLAQTRVSIDGTVSNVPYHLIFGAWIDEFNRKNPNIQVRYLPLGTSFRHFREHETSQRRMRRFWRGRSATNP